MTSCLSILWDFFIGPWDFFIGLWGWLRRIVLCWLGPTCFFVHPCILLIGPKQVKVVMLLLFWMISADPSRFFAEKVHLVQTWVEGHQKEAPSGERKKFLWNPVLSLQFPSIFPHSHLSALSVFEVFCEIPFYLHNFLPSFLTPLLSAYFFQFWGPVKFWASSFCWIRFIVLRVSCVRLCALPLCSYLSWANWQAEHLNIFKTSTCFDRTLSNGHCTLSSVQ